MVLCAAKTEQSEPGVARAEGIAHKIIQHKTRPVGTRPNENQLNLNGIAHKIIQHKTRPKGTRPNKPNKKILNVITPKLIQTTKSRTEGIAHKIISQKIALPTKK